MNILEALKTGNQLLAESPAYLKSCSSMQERQIDSEVLLSFVLQQSRTYLKTWPELEITQTQVEHFLSLIQQRSQNYPCAYLTGQQEFWSLPFHVNDNVLIPRPETECLIEFLLEHFSQVSSPLTGLDLGTGSGAIAISLAKERKNWHLLACDISTKALACAKENAKQLEVNNIEFIESDWFSKITHTNLDFIISNPPYIEENAKELSSEAIKFEPREALCSGINGLDAIKEICNKAQYFLKAQAPLIIEHGYQQAADVCKIFEHAGFNQVKCLQDYSQLDRFTLGFKP